MFSPSSDKRIKYWSNIWKELCSNIIISFFLQVIGLRVAGQDNQYRFQNCTLYNPDQISMLGDSLTNDARIEIRNAPRVDKDSFSLIKIDLEAIDPDIGYEKALEKAIHLVNIFNLIYNQPNYGTQIWTTNYFYVDEAGWRTVCDGIQFPGNMEYQPEVLDCKTLDNVIESIKFTNLYDKGFVLELDTINKAIYYYTKAQAAQTDEEMLLNYWISIECLFESTKDKFNTIQSIIACAAVLFAKSDTLINLYQKIYYYHRKDLQLFSEKGAVELPEELAIEFGMHLNQKPNLAVFKSKLKEIDKYVYRENILQMIEHVDQIYSDAKVARSALGIVYEKAQQEIIYIYKCRNQIVHNGYNNRIMLSFVAKSAERHAKRVLLLFLSIFSYFGLNVTDAVKKIEDEVSKLFTDLAGGKIDALKLELFSGTGILYNAKFKDQSIN